MSKFCTNARISNKFIRRHLLTKSANYKVLPVMVSTHGSVVPLAMFADYNMTRYMFVILLIIIPDI